ncbi:hypothetical protein DFH07DRAFT_834194 [Mycena maculata]|uniref:F-box domain-containing protein n=1 Tax=Mycena maculata TaxID=230809 RepID=A0AAD7IKN9_9AGAR|nr:hypothetical protein DFH07DRAFT_834194 [Mycena maculata]
MAPRKKKGKNTVEALASLYPASLKGFPALPLDILFEIFSLVHPLDLVYLTRTTKPFRRFLLNRANVAIWRAAFANSANEGGPPGCPTYMCEPAWARVAFEKACHVCFVNLRDDPNLDSVWWEFGTRYCGDCMRSQVSQRISVKVKRLDPRRNWEAVFPRVPRSTYVKSYYYLLADQHKVLDAYTKTENDEERAALFQTCRERTNLIMEHSKLCREWAAKQIENRRKEAENRREEKEEKQEAKQRSRLQAIVAKLTALGWSDETWMVAGTLSEQIRDYPSVAVPRLLAPRAYRDLEPTLILQLNTDKRTWFLKQRFQVFMKAFPRIISQAELDKLALGVPPRHIDVVLIPAVRALLEKDGEAPVVADDLVQTLRPTMPSFLQTWSGECMVLIHGHARKLLKLDESDNQPAPDPGVSDPTALAVAYIACPLLCGVAGHYNTLLKHSCKATYNDRHWLYTPYHGTSDENGGDIYEKTAADTFCQRRFAPTMLHFGNRLPALEGLLRAYGRNPKTTTVQDMTSERRLVHCSPCVAMSKDARHPSVTVHPLDWLAAMSHSTKYHLRQDEIRWEISGKHRASDVDV